MQQNDLISVPLEISSMLNLVELDLGRNQLTRLPAEAIGRLTHLRHLDVSCNRIGLLPNTLISCTKLEKLVLFDNNFYTIDGALLTHLERLTHLDFRCGDKIS
jgi:Leucine-rich repeat (LRR) protein